MPTVEERLAVVETKTDTGIELLKEIRDDVKDIGKVNTNQDLRLASLEQTRDTAKKGLKILGVPVFGTVIHTILKSIGVY